MRVTKTGGAERIDGPLDVAGKGTCEVEPKGLDGPVTREHSMVGQAIVMARGKLTLPGSIRSRKEALDSSSASSALVRSISR